MEVPSESFVGALGVQEPDILGVPQIKGSPMIGAKGTRPLKASEQKIRNMILLSPIGETQKSPKGLSNHRLVRQSLQTKLIFVCFFFFGGGGG